jgi:hypothetical protein
MNLGRSWRTAAVVSLAALALLPACRRRKPAETSDITPKIEVNRPRAPLGSAIEVTYTWQLDPTGKKLDQDHRAFVHFLDSHKVLLFDDDHVPVPPVTAWEPGKTYSYTRTKFIPVYPYVGDVDLRVGLQPVARGERVALKGQDAGLREYSVGKMELLPQTENIFLVYKEGWHSPETSAQNPSLERMWTKKDAIVSFKNPKKDIIVYLEADTNYKAFDQPPVLTIAVGNKAGLVVPIENSEVFLKKVRVKAADLGDQEWVDLRLSMNQSFIPKAKGINPNDDRELGLMRYNLYVGEADKLGNVPSVVDAVPVSLPPLSTASPAPGASPATGGKGAPRLPLAPAAPKGSPAAKASAAPAKPASPAVKPSASPKK